MRGKKTAAGAARPGHCHAPLPSGCLAAVGRSPSVGGRGAVRVQNPTVIGTAAEKNASGNAAGSIPADAAHVRAQGRVVGGCTGVEP